MKKKAQLWRMIPKHDKRERILPWLDWGSEEKRTYLSDTFGSVIRFQGDFLVVQEASDEDVEKLFQSLVYGESGDEVEKE